MSIYIVYTMEIREQLVKDVTEIGNGAHIFVPRDWLNQKVSVIKMPKLTVKEQIIKSLTPYLDDIVGVFLYGSYARGEQEETSDIDVLVVAKKKFKIKTKGKLSFEVVEYSKLEKNIELNPLMFYSIIQEAKPIINLLLLEEFKKIKFNTKAPVLKWFIDTTKDHIKTNKEFIELDKLDGNYLTSSCVVYSLILRLRGILLIRGMLYNKPYTRSLFRQWLTSNVPGIEYKKIYDIYRAVRDEKKVKCKIKLSQVESLLNLLKKEINRLEDRLYGK